MSILKYLLILVPATLLLNSNAFALSGSAKGKIKDTLQIRQCGPADKNTTPFNIKLSGNGKWTMKTSDGTFSGQYTEKKKGKKLSLGLSKKSASNIIKFLGIAGTELCKQRVTILSPKISKFTATRKKGKLKLSLLVKFKATNGSSTENGTYKITANGNYKAKKPKSKPKPPASGGVNLSKLMSTKTGPVFSDKLVGTYLELGGGGGFPGTVPKLTGTVKIVNRKKEMLRGVLVTPRETTLTASKKAASWKITEYMAADGTVLQFEDRNTGVFCAPPSPDRMPAKIKQGDGGYLPIQMCDNSTQREVSWTTEKAPKGGTLITFAIGIRDSFGQPITTEEVSYTLAKNGTIRDYENFKVILGTATQVYLESKSR